VVGPATNSFPTPFKTVTDAITNQCASKLSVAVDSSGRTGSHRVATAIRGWKICSEPKLITSQGLFQSSRLAAQVTMCGWRRGTSTEAKPGRSLHVWTRDVRRSSFRQKNPDSSIETRPRRVRGRSFSIQWMQQRRA